MWSERAGEMVECAHCGTAGRPDDVTCRACGAPLPGAHTQSPAPVEAPADPWPSPMPATAPHPAANAPYWPYAYPAYAPQYGYPPTAYAGYPNGRQPAYQAYTPYY